MNKFVSTQDGRLINTRFIREVSPDDVAELDTGLRVKLASGFDLQDVTVPAGPDWYCVGWAEDDSSADGIDAWSLPVIAWQLRSEGDYAIPFTDNGVYDRGYAYNQKTGRWSANDGYGFGCGIETMLEEIYQRAERQRQRKLRSVGR